MAETKISWADFTSNYWIGCTKISEGCRNCYAATLSERKFEKTFAGGRKLWGPNAHRHMATGVWSNVRKWNKQSPQRDNNCMGPGTPAIVFCGSLMDWAEPNDKLVDVRKTMWDQIRECTNVYWMMLTKRADCIEQFLPEDWNDGWPHVWLGTSVEDMRVEKRIQQLAAVPAAARFISYEPALGPLHEANLDGIDQVLYGGESGPGFRPEGTTEDPKCWARSMRKACKDQKIAFFHKQSASYRTEMGVELDGKLVHNFPKVRKIKHPTITEGFAVNHNYKKAVEKKTDSLF